MYIYCIINSVASYMFRPPVVAIFSASSVHGHESFQIPFRP